MMHYAYGVSKEFPGYLYIAHSSSRRSIKFSKDNCILYTGLASTHHLGIYKVNQNCSQEHEGGLNGKTNRVKDDSFDSLGSSCSG